MSPRTLSAIHGNAEAEIAFLRGNGYTVEDVTVEEEGREFCVSLIVRHPVYTENARGVHWFGDYTSRIDAHAVGDALLEVLTT